jgi:hypothetical protein
MGYNARNDEIRDNITRMRREWEAQRGSLATVRLTFRTLSTFMGVATSAVLPNARFENEELIALDRILCLPTASSPIPP